MSATREAPRFLQDVDEFDMPIVRDALARPKAAPQVRSTPAARAGISVRKWAIGVGAIAALLRVGYLLYGTTDSRFVAWYIDSFHHWQISYLSKEIGFGQARLWDLGGMEYFWGFIPAVLGAIAMALTFSNDLWPMQAMNIVAGSASVGTLYLVGRRYWSHWAGLALAVFFAVSPVSVLTDASVMQEPVAFLFLSLALLFFLDRPLLAGALLGLASSSRPDYWLYSGALLATGVIALRAKGSFVAGLRTALPYAGGYALGLAPYALHLFVQTGNPLYSLYWNFLGNVRGEWMPDIEPSARQLQAQFAARVLFGIGTVGLALTAWRRPTGWPVIAAGLWGFFLIGYVLGISKYILGYLDRFWFDRIMLLPYLAVAVLIAVAVARVARIPRIGRGIAAAMIALSAVGLSALWLPIESYTTDAAGFHRDLDFADRAAAVATEGQILVPGDAVVATYGLVHEGVEARRLVSQLYHPEERAELDAWMSEMEIRWIFLKAGGGFWSDLVRNDPERFPLRLSWVYDLYEVRP